MKSAFFSLAVLLSLIVVSSSPLQAQMASKEVDLDIIDRLFGAVESAKGETVASTLQNWVRVQELFRMIGIVNEDSESSGKRKWQADYVGGYGFRIVKLYDLACTMQRRCLEEAKSKRQVSQASSDLGASLELIGEFQESVNVRKDGMQKSNDKSYQSLNNLSLVLLKAGEYEECIKTVNQVPLNKEYAASRKFSARAFAWTGRYAEAAAEAAKACENGECELQKELRATRDTVAFWRRDSLKRTEAWQPDNRLESERWLPTEVLSATFGQGTEVSHYIVSSWFTEIYPLYDLSSDDDGLAIPATLDSVRFGFVSIGGVPIFTLAFPKEMKKNDVRDSVAAFLKSMHGPSAWGEDLPVYNHGLMAQTETGEWLVAIFHIDWQEELIRERGKGLKWKEVEAE